MTQHTISAELIRLVDTTTRKLRTFDETLVREKAGPKTWSIQEILGHLIDSAVNNQHRFVRAQQVDTLHFPAYDQDHWVHVQGYNRRSWPEVVELWRLCNLHLAQTVSRIPDQKLATVCRIGTNDPVTLDDLIRDYLVHLNHHLDQIYEKNPIN